MGAKKSISNSFTVNTVEDGTSPYFADLDNGIDSVACDYQGVTTSEQFVETNVCMFFGNQKQVIPISGGIVCKIGNTTLGSSYQDSGVGYNYKVEVTNLGTTSAHIKLSVRDNTEIDSTTVTITVSVVGETGNVSANLDFVINGVRAGKNGDAAVIYNLFPSSSEVVVARTGDGGYNPRYNTLRCGYKKSVGDSPIVVTDATSTIDGLYRIFFRRRKRSDGAWETADRNRTVYYFYGDNVYTHYLVPNSATSGLDALTYDMVEFVLYKDTSSSILYSLVQSNVVDKEIVGIVSDGQSAPSYPKEYYAWSSEETTTDANTEPRPNSGWSTSIGAQGAYAYLWKKVETYTLNSNGKSYSLSSTQYFRMTGTSGTSINTKGEVDYAATTVANLPTTSAIVGKKGIAKNSANIYLGYNPAPDTYAWTAMSTASANDAYTVKSGNFGSGSIDGHLIQLNSEANTWVDLGQFKGQDGTTYYTHIVWASNVTFSGGVVQTITGYLPVKPEGDTEHPWMGVHVDTNNTDPIEGDNILKTYTWSNTKGDTGEAGESAASVIASPSSIVIECDSNGHPKTNYYKDVVFSLKVGTSSVTINSRSAGTLPSGFTVE